MPVATGRSHSPPALPAPHRRSAPDGLASAQDRHRRYTIRQTDSVRHAPKSAPAVAKSLAALVLPRSAKRRLLRAAKHHVGRTFFAYGHQIASQPGLHLPRPRAFFCRSCGYKRSHSGGAKRSSRYSVMAEDSLSEKNYPLPAAARAVSRSNPSSPAADARRCRD